LVKRPAPQLKGEMIVVDTLPFILIRQVCFNQTSSLVQLKMSFPGESERQTRQLVPKNRSCICLLISPTGSRWGNGTGGTVLSHIMRLLFFLQLTSSNWQQLAPTGVLPLWDIPTIFTPVVTETAADVPKRCKQPELEVCFQNKTPSSALPTSTPCLGMGKGVRGRLLKIPKYQIRDMNIVSQAVWNWLKSKDTHFTQTSLKVTVHLSCYAFALYILSSGNNCWMLNDDTDCWLFNVCLLSDLHFKG